MDESNKKLATLSLLIRAALVGFAISAAFNLVTPIFMLTSSISYSASAAFGIFASLTFIAALALLVCSLACIVLIPIWTYRAHGNLWRANLSGLTHSPGWATAAWFIPMVNLAVPFSAMKQLYNRSLGESEYQQADGIGMVVSWWTCSLAWLLVFAALLVITFFNVLTNVFVTMPPIGEAGLLIMNALLQLGAAFYLFKIIGAISKAQDAGQHMGQSSTFE